MAQWYRVVLVFQSPGSGFDAQAGQISFWKKKFCSLKLQSLHIATR